MRPCAGCCRGRCARCVRPGKRSPSARSSRCVPWPSGHEIDVAAVGTSPREPLGMAAMVAAQDRGFAVDDEPGAAARATGLPAARRAEERQRKPAPIDEDERLFAAIEPRRERRHRAARRCLRAPMASRLRHEHGSRGRRAGVTARRGNLSQTIARLLRMDERLERRRCAAEHDGNVALPRAPDGDVAAVIANAVLLLERGIVFFVDDDERRAAAAA